MGYTDTPNGEGTQHGSAYNGGYVGIVLTLLAQLGLLSPPDAFGAEITSRMCTGGPATCHAAIDAALLATYNALVAANGGSTNVATWTNSTKSKAAGVTMPQYDSIDFKAIGLIDTPNIDWQNRPTFQQVIEFPRHRPR